MPQVTEIWEELIAEGHIERWPDMEEAILPPRAQSATRQILITPRADNDSAVASISMPANWVNIAVGRYAGLEPRSDECRR